MNNCSKAAKDNLIYILLVLMATFLFADRYTGYAVVFLAVTYLCVSGKNPKLHKTSMLFVFLSILALTAITFLLAMFPSFSDLADGSVSGKEICRLIIYTIIAECLMVIRVDLKAYIKIWRVLLIFIVAIAVIQYTKIFDVTAVLKSIYGDSIQYQNTTAADLASFRSGSVFVNPNVFACFLVAMLGSYLFILQQTKENLIRKLITFILLGIGFILSGSRTGFVLGIAIIIAYMVVGSKRNRRRLFGNLVLLLGGLVLLAVVASLMGYIELSDIFSLRIFQVKAGTGNSIKIKLGIFAALISDMNGMNLIFGYGPFNYAANSNLLVDFDFGYFATYFGFCGMVVYLFLLHAIYRWGDRSLCGRRFLNLVFLIIAVLFGLTAGVYFNLRIFSIYMLVFMPALFKGDDQVA